MGGELEDSALTEGTGRDDANVGRVVDGDNDAGGQDNLLPGRLSALLKTFQFPAAPGPEASVVRTRSCQC